VTDLEHQFERILREEISRRRLLRRGAAGALGASALAYLAACGETGGGGGDGGGETEKAVIKKEEIADSLYFANWPDYIDPEHQTLKKFQDKYGTKVKYVEEINDNNEFFGKVRQQYARGDSGGRDLHVVTDWMAARMIRLGYVQKLDHAALPNVQANLVDRLKHPPFDPNREFSVPWQSGFAGIIYRKDKVKRTPKSVDDLFDPAYKGKVTMLTEMPDTVGVVAASMGFDPEKATVDQFLQAIEKIGKAVDSGQIRGFTGNEYIKDLPKGDSWVIIGWSGDAIQLQADDPNIRWVAPESGVHLWTDNMQIPVGAPHAYTAEKMMDFVYQPENQAPIEAYINYICPVKGVKEVFEKKDPSLVDNQLIFPNEEALSNSFIFRNLKPDEEQKVNEAFQGVIGA
jgi:spermidine/putrescine transport system substrate-binding protein